MGSKREQHAFTLVELRVAVGIVALRGGIADKEGFHEAEEVKANILFGDFHIEANVRFSTDGP